MPAPVPARFRPVPDAALVTGRSHRTIRTWAARGRIPSLKVGDRMLVDLVAAVDLSKQASRRNPASTAA